MPDMKTLTIDDTTFDIVDAAAREHMENKDNPHGVTAEQAGAAPMDYAKKVGNPYNLLDNSDFRNPVNQRCINSGDVITNSYWIDRWMLTNKSTVTFGDGYINISANMNFPAYLRQFFETETKFPCTFSMRTVDDIFTFVFTGYDQRRTIENGMYCVIQKTNNFLDIYIPQDLSISIVNMALYEGEYTAETLPEYQPKGYYVELASCGGYAPAGYGLGERAFNAPENDANKITKCGFFRAYVNTPTGDWWTIQQEDLYGDGTYMIQKASCYAYTFVLHAERIKVNGTFYEWEWVNPPMNVGVEYRTTERWNGKPVWKSLTKITGLPNNAYGMYNLAATYCERMVGKHISYERTDGADFLEYIEAGEIYFGNYGTPYIVFNKTQADLSTMTAYVTLFYTKTTD